MYNVVKIKNVIVNFYNNDDKWQGDRRRLLNYILNVK